MRRAWWVLPLVVVSLALAALGWLYWQQQRPPATVELAELPPHLGRGPAAVTVKAGAPSGHLATLVVKVVQGDREKTLVDETFPAPGPAEVSRTVPLDLAALELKEGAVQVVATATDATWRPSPAEAATATRQCTVDLTPPPLELVAWTGYVKHAGSALLVYRTSDASRSGVEVGGTFFPGHAGMSPDDSVHVALLAFPHDQDPVPPQAVSEDAAGNRRVAAVPVNFLPAKFGTDHIQLTDSFLRRKVPELAPDVAPDASTEDLLARYLTINGEQRQADETRIREIASGPTSPRPLWSGTFRQQSNTKVFAGFPESRSYSMDGRNVDEQWHLGLDLASNKRSPVEASNAGRVVFTGGNGIYGNMVVLDHGLGLMSLYAHLSEIGVQVGQDVAQGESLGRTGETGMAGGDHLHFAMLVGGRYVNPVEWWDSKWIQDRVALPLRDAGISAPGITEVKSASLMAAGAQSAVR